MISSDDHRRRSRSKIRADPYRALDFEAPIILVGAGRSGSTILDAVIEAHPEVYSIGEVSFLLHRMWDAFGERDSYYENIKHKLALDLEARQVSLTPSGFGWSNIKGFWDRFRRTPLRRLSLSWKDLAFAKFMLPFGHYPVSMNTISEPEDRRRVRQMGENFARLMIPPQLVRPRWLFREIWIGSKAVSYDYGLFKSAFPKARYVQAIRHPIDFLSSVAEREGGVLSDEHAVNHLSAWVSMVQQARDLAGAERYFEIRYEDLVAGGEPLRKLFGFLDLSPHPDCFDRLDVRLVGGKAGLDLSDKATPWIDATPGLRSIMESLGYPDQPFGRLRPQAKSLPEWRRPWEFAEGARPD